MSYFDCEHGTRYELFGKSQCGLLQGEYGFPVAVALPLDPHVGAAASSGMPSVLSDPTSPIAEKYGELAASLALEIPRTRLFEPEIRVEGSVITISVGPKTLSIPARKLRLACQVCATPWCTPLYRFFFVGQLTPLQLSTPPPPLPPFVTRQVCVVRG